jgi:hypothetical protein
MANHYQSWIVTVSLFAVLLLPLTLISPSHALAGPQEQYPILDKIAEKVIQKYQTSTCEQLWIKKSEKGSAKR